MLAELAVLAMLLPKAVQLLQPIYIWGSSQLSFIAAAVLGLVWRGLVQAPRDMHQKELKEVSKAHADSMQMYKHIGPMNMPAMNVYAAYASAYGVLDGLTEHVAAERLLEAAPLRLGKFEVQILNQSSILLQARCKEDAASAVYVAAGQRHLLELPSDLPEQITVILEGYRADYSVIELAASLDRSQVNGVTVFEANGHIDIAPVA